MVSGFQHSVHRSCIVELERCLENCIVVMVIDCDDLRILDLHFDVYQSLGDGPLSFVIRHPVSISFLSIPIHIKSKSAAALLPAGKSHLCVSLFSCVS